MSIEWSRLLVARGAAVAAVAGAVWFTASTLRSSPSRWRVLERKSADLQELRMLTAGGADGRTARRMLESLPVGEPSFVQNVAGRLLGEVDMDIQEAEPEALGEGWLRRTVDVSLEDVALEKVMHLITALEEERPPWRLRSCVIEAAGDRPGWGRAALKFEALHREQL